MFRRVELAVRDRLRMPIEPDQLLLPIQLESPDPFALRLELDHHLTPAQLMVTISPDVVTLTQGHQHRLDPPHLNP